MTDKEKEIAKERFAAQGFAVDEENKKKFKEISEYIDKNIDKKISTSDMSK